MFDTTQFVGYLFALMFLFLCCLWGMLYSHKGVAFIVSRLVSWFVLPRGSYFRVGGLLLSPMQQRVLFKDLSYVSPSGAALSCIDGHLTWNFRGFGLLNPGYTALRAFMCHEGLVGHIIEVHIDGMWRPAAVVSVARVASSTAAAASPADTKISSDTPISAIRVTARVLDNFSGTDSSVGFLGRLFGSSRRSYLYRAQQSGDRSPSRQTNGNLFASDTSELRSETSMHGIEVIVSASACRLAVKPSRLRLHINGMGVALFHSKGKYDALEAIVAALLPPGVQNASRGPAATPAASEPATAHEIERSRAEQHKKDTAYCRMMKILGSVDVQLYASYIDMGALEAEHPYFLHFGFERADVCYLLTNAEAEFADHHRHVVECAFEHVDLKWAHVSMNLRGETNSDYAQWKQAQRQKVSRIRLFKERAQLMFEGMAGAGSSAASGTNQPSSRAQFSGNPSPAADAPVDDLIDVDLLDAPSDLVRQYGTIIDKESNSDVRVVYYWDTAGVHVGEHTPSVDSLPKMGVDVELRVSSIAYGPWSNYSRAQLQSHFFPPTFAELFLPKLVRGQPRPYGGFEASVLFVTDCILAVPFKLKAPTPSVPYGIRDSGRSESVVVEIGAGSVYRFRPAHSHVNPETPAESLFAIGESYFEAVRCNIFTSLHTPKGNGRSLFLTADSMRLHYDVFYPHQWHQRSEVNTIVTFANSNMYYYAEHAAFFTALISDWNYVPQMYSGVPFVSAKFHNRKMMVDNATPSLVLYELFFEKSFALHFGANAYNIVTSSGASDTTTSTDSNAFIALRCNGGALRYQIPNDTYFVDDVNEQKHCFDIALHDAALHALVSNTHPLHDLATAEALRVDMMTFDGSYVVRTQNLSVEQHASRVPTNSTPGRAKLCNSLKVAVGMHRLQGNLTGVLVTHLMNAWDNLFGSSRFVISAADYYWLAAQSKLPPENRAALLAQFLQRNEPKANELELIATVAMRDVELGASVGGHDSIPVLTTHAIDVSVASQTSFSELSVTTAPVLLRTAKPSADCTSKATWLPSDLRHARPTASSMKSGKSQKVVSIPLEDEAAAPRTAATAAAQQQSAASRRSSLNPPQDTSAFAIPPLSAAAGPSSLFTGPVGSQSPFVCLQSVRFGRVSHFGPEPFYVKFHGVLEAHVGAVTFHLPVDTAARITAVFVTFGQHLKVVDPARQLALSRAKTYSEATGEYLDMAHARTASAIPTHSAEQSMSPGPVGGQSAGQRHRRGGTLNTTGASSGGGGGQGAPSSRSKSRSEPSTVLGRRHRNASYNCSLFQIPESAASAFASYLELRQQHLDESIDLGVFTTRVSTGCISGSLVALEESVLTLRVGGGVHVATSSLNDTNSNKRTSATASAIALRLLRPKTAEMFHADVPGDAVEVALLEASVVFRHTTAYPYESAGAGGGGSGTQQGIYGHFLRQTQYIRYCDYEHLVNFSYNSVFPRSGAAPAPSTSRRFGVSNGQTASGVFLPDGASDEPLLLHTNSSIGGVSRLSRKEVAELARIAPQTFAAAIGRLDGDEFARAEESEGDEFSFASDDTNARRCAAALAVPSTATDGKGTTFHTCQSELTGGPDDETSDAASVDSRTPSDVYSEDSGATFVAAAGAGATPARATGRPAMQFYRCHRAFEVVPYTHQSVQQFSLLSTLMATSYSSRAAAAGAADNGTGTDTTPTERRLLCIASRDYSNFHAHIPSICFVEHEVDRCAAHGASAHSPGVSRRDSPKKSSQQRQQSVETNATNFSETSPTDACAFLFAQEYDRYVADDEDFSQSAEGPPLVWARRSVDNNRRSRDGSTTQHYHIEFPTAVKGWCTQDGAAALLSLYDRVFKAWQHATAAIIQYDGASTTVGAVTSTPTRPDVVRLSPTGAASPLGKPPRAPRHQSRSRNKSRVKQWTVSDDILSLVVPCIEVKWLQRCQPLQRHSGNAGGSAETARQTSGSLLEESIVTSTVASRALQLVLQRTCPPRRLTRSAGARKTIKYGLSFCVATIAAWTQVNFEPAARVGSLNVDIPLISYHRGHDHVGIAYITNATLRGKRDFVGENQSAVFRASVESIIGHTTPEARFVVDSLKAALREAAGNRQSDTMAPPTATPPQTSQRVTEVSNSAGPIISGAEHAEDSSDVSEDDDEEQVDTAVATSSTQQGAGGMISSRRSSVTPAVVTAALVSIVPDNMLWQVQGVFAISNVVRLELYDVQRVVRPNGEVLIVVHADRPTVAQFVRPVTNVKLSTASSTSPLSIEVLSDIHLCQLKVNPTLPHFLSSIQKQQLRPSGGSRRPSPQTSSNEAMSFQHQAQLAAEGRDVQYRPTVLLTTTLCVRQVDCVVLESELNYVQLSGRQWSCCARTCEKELFSEPCFRQQQRKPNTPNTFSSAANSTMQQAPSALLTPSDVKALRASFSKRVLMLLCKKALQVRQKYHRCTFPPNVSPCARLRSSITVFAESAAILYTADLLGVASGSETGVDTSAATNTTSDGAGPLLTRTAVASLPTQRSHESASSHVAPSVSQRTTARDLPTVVSVSLRDATAAVHRSVHHYDPKTHQANIFTAIHSVSLRIPYRSQMLEVIQPQLKAFVSEWSTALKEATSADAKASALSPVADAAASEARRAAPSAVVVHAELNRIDFLVGLPQDANVRLDLPKISLTARTCSPRALVKVHVFPFQLSAKLPTSAGSGSSLAKGAGLHTAGRSLITFPAVFANWSQDADKSNTTVLMENLEAVVDPALTNHILMTYEKVVTELVDIVTSSTKSEAARAGHSSTLTADAQRQTHSSDPQTVEQRRSFVTFSVRSIRVSLVTSMTETRFIVRQLDVAREVHHERRDATKWLSRCVGLRLSMVDRDDRNQHTELTSVTPPLGASTGTPAQRLAKAAKPSSGHIKRPAPVTMVPVASSPQSTAKLLGGYVWGHAEVSWFVRADWVLAEPRRGNSTRQASSANPPHKSADTTPTASWSIAFTAFTPYAIIRAGLQQHVAHAIKEINQSLATMRAAVVQEASQLRRRLEVSTAYQQFVDRQRRKFRTAAATAPEEEPLSNQTSADFAPAEHRALAGGLRRKRPGVPNIGSPDISSSSAAAAPVSRRVSAASKRFVVLVTVVDAQVIVPCGDAAFRTLMEGRVAELLEKSQGGVDAMLNRSKFVPVMSLRVHLQTIKAQLVSEEVKQSLERVTPCSGVDFADTAPANRKASAARPSKSWRTTWAEHDTAVKGSLQAKGLHVFLSDGTRLPPNMQEQTRFLAAARTSGVVVLGGVGSLTETAASDVAKERNRSFDKLHIAEISSPFSMKKSHVTEPQTALFVDAPADGRRISKTTRRTDDTLLPPTPETPAGAPPHPIACAAPTPVVYQASVSVSGPEAHLTSRCTAMLGALMDDFNVPDIELPAASAASSRRPAAAKETSPTAKLLNATTSATPPRSEITATAQLQPGKILLYSWNSPAHSGASPAGSTDVGNVSFGGSAAPTSRGRKPFDKSQRRQVSFSDGGGDPSLWGLRPPGAATQVMEIPLPSASATARIMSGGDATAPDETTARIAVQCKRINVDPAIAVLWQEVQTWTQLHLQESRDKAQWMVRHVEELARTAVARQVVPGGVRHSGAQPGPATPLAPAASTSFLDTALPVPKVFVLELLRIRSLASGGSTGGPPSDLLKANLPEHSGTWHVLSPMSVSSSQSIEPATSPSPRPAESAAEEGAVMGSSTKPSSLSIHMNLTGIRFEFSTVSGRVLRQGDSIDGGKTDASLSSNTIATVYTDAGGAVDCVFMRSLGSPAVPTPLWARQTTAPPSMVYLVTASGVRLECQNKVEVKSLEVHIPKMVFEASLRDVRLITEGMEEGGPATAQSSPSARRGDFDRYSSPESSGRGVRGQRPAPLDASRYIYGPGSSSETAPLAQGATTAVRTVAVHVHADGAADGERFGGPPSVGPQVTVRAQHVNQLLLVVMHWKQEWEAARAQAVLLFRTTSSTKSNPTPADPPLAVRRRQRSLTLQALPAPSVDLSRSQLHRSATAGAGMLRPSPRDASAVTAKRAATVVTQYSVIVGRSDSRIDLGSGNKHEFSIGSMTICGRSVVYETLESLTQASGQLKDCRIRSEGVLSGTNSVASVRFQGFSVGVPTADEVLLASNGTKTLDPKVALRPLRTREGRTKRFNVDIMDLNLHFKERQIRDVAMFSMDAFRLDAKDSCGVLSDCDAGAASPQKRDGSQRADKQEDGPGAALITITTEKCLMGITPQTSASFLSVASDVATILREQEGIAAHNLQLLQQQSGSIAGRGNRQAVAAPADGTAVAPEAQRPRPPTNAVRAIEYLITSGQVSVSVKYTTVVVGTVIDARHLVALEGALLGGGGDSVTLRVPDLQVDFAQLVVPADADAANGELLSSSQRGDVAVSGSPTSEGSKPPAAPFRLMARLRGYWQSTVTRKSPDSASSYSASTPVKVLTADPHFHANSSSETKCQRQTATVRRFLVVSVESVELTRRQGEHLATVLAFRGTNLIEFLSEEDVTRLMLPDDVEGSARLYPSRTAQSSLQSQSSRPSSTPTGMPVSEVLHRPPTYVGRRMIKYSLLLRQTHPWTGSPKIEDFNALRDVIRTFTQPQRSAAVINDFAMLRKSMYPIEETERGERDAEELAGTDYRHELSGAAAARDPFLLGDVALQSPHCRLESVDLRLVPMDAAAGKRSRFAPQLRFGRDVSVNLDTILSWIGTREEMIPEQLFLSVCAPLEALMAKVEGCMATADAIDASIGGVVQELPRRDITTAGQHPLQ